MQGKLTDFFEMLDIYIDAKISYELASIEEGADGYRQSCVEDRKLMEGAKENVLKLIEGEHTIRFEE